MISICLIRFAQRSMDHRGNPTFPGVVVTLIPDNADVVVESECIGVIYHFPSSDAEELIKELDYRERGGYNRHVIKVQLLEHTSIHPINEIVSAIVYSGSIDNPNFLNPNILHIDSLHHHPVMKLPIRDVVADIISAAIGPSGPNIDYLFQLTSYIREKNDKQDVIICDTYLMELEYKVRMRMGLWCGMIVSHDGTKQGVKVKENIADPVYPNTVTSEVVLGWGSNEQGQLIPGCSTSIFSHAIPMVGMINNDKIQPIPYTIPSSLVLYSHDGMIPSRKAYVVGVYAGATVSGILWNNHELIVWGTLWDNYSHGDGNKDKHPTTYHRYNGVVGVCMSPDPTGGILVLHQSGHIIHIQAGGDKSGGENQMQCTSRRHLTQEKEEEVSVCTPSEVGCVSEREWVELSHDSMEKTCHPGVFTPALSLWTHTFTHIYTVPAPRIRVKLIGMGLKHTLVVGADNTGKDHVYAWGSNKYGQCGSEDQDIDGKKWVKLSHIGSILSIACGARHSVIIDSQNNVWTCGDNRYGSLGRDVIPSPEGKLSHRGCVDGVLRKVQLLPDNIIWQRVCTICCVYMCVYS